MEEKVMKDCKVLALCSQKGGVGKTRVLQEEREDKKNEYDCFNG